MIPPTTFIPKQTKTPKKLAHLLALSFFLCLPFLGSAQQEDWQWGIRGGSVTTNGNNVPITETVDDMAVDEAGNTYIVSQIGGGIGRQGGTLSGMGGNLPFYGETDNSSALLLASYDCNGVYRWSKTVSGYSTSTLPRVGLDSLGHVYMTGHLSHSYKDIFTGEEFLTHFDSDSIIPYSDKINEYKKKLFLARYDTAGNFEELIMPQSDSVHRFAANYQNALDLMVDPDGTQHVFARANNYTAPDGTVYPPVLEGDTLAQGFYALRYDSQGTYLGKVAFELQNIDLPRSIFRVNHDPVRDVYYLAGQNRSYDTPNSDLEIGGQVVESPMFVAKFNAQGQTEWLKEGSPTVPQSNRFYGRPQLDAQGNVYLSGVMQAEFQQSTIVQFNGYSASNKPGEEYSSFVVLIKIDPSGNLIWGTHGQTDNGVYNEFIAVNGQEVVHAGAHGGITWGNETFPPVPNSGYDVYLARFNKEDGSFIAMDSLNSSYGADEKPTALVADKRGNVYVGGDFESRLFLPNDTINKNGSQTDFFVAKFGTGNCNCTLPDAKFSYNVSTPGEVTYSFTGSGYDELEWSYGNGETETLSTPTVNHSYTENKEYWVCVTSYNNCGYDTWCTMVDPFTLGNPNLLEESTLKHYPNPVQNTLSLETKEDLSYKLYSLSGKQLRNGQLHKGTTNLNVADLAQGLYMLRVENSAGNTRTLKIVKE